MTRKQVLDIVKMKTKDLNATQRRSRVPRHRRHRPQHGHRSRRLISSIITKPNAGEPHETRLHRKINMPKVANDTTKRSKWWTGPRTIRSSAPSKSWPSSRRPKFNETVDLAFRLGVDPKQSRPDGPRHRSAAARQRQDGPRARLRRRRMPPMPPRPPARNSSASRT